MMQQFVLNIPSLATQHAGKAGGELHPGRAPLPVPTSTPSAADAPQDGGASGVPSPPSPQAEPGLMMRLIGSEALIRLVLTHGVIPNAPLSIPPRCGRSLTMSPCATSRSPW